MANNRDSAPPSPRPGITLSNHRPENAEHSKQRAREASLPQMQPRNGIIPRAFFPGGDRSLSGIALRAFLLGNGAVLGLLLSLVFAYHGNRFWRPSFFVGILSVFHFLEFYTTAAYNTPSAFISSFLLANGYQYRLAHSIAFIETLITSYFFPTWQARVSPPSAIVLGMTLVVVGQIVRSLAMVQAGTNFNHLVQSRKNDGHELVTTGLYAYFRHPSYFGFFWWGLGAQVALGNTVSFIGYAGILWYFFKTRIIHEEKHLVQFFGNDYRDYRARTSVWIPFIW